MAIETGSPGVATAGGVVGVVGVVAVGASDVAGPPDVDAEGDGDGDVLATREAGPTMSARRGPGTDTRQAAPIAASAAIDATSVALARDFFISVRTIAP